jgi:hypothetical protein
MVESARQSKTAPGPNAVSLDVYVRDRDGFVNDVTVTWGDGTTESKQHPLADCRDEKTHWPWPNWASFTLQHTYGSSGAFVVEVVVSSSGCDGGNPQSATKRVTVQAMA